MEPRAIILSPGPGRPEHAGVCIEVVRTLGDRIPILGVCLGHQSICEAYGATVSYAKQLMHGKTSLVSLDNDSKLFYGMPPQIQAAGTIPGGSAQNAAGGAEGDGGNQGWGDYGGGAPGVSVYGGTVPRIHPDAGRRFHHSKFSGGSGIMIREAIIDLSNGRIYPMKPPRRS